MSNNDNSFQKPPIELSSKTSKGKFLCILTFFMIWLLFILSLWLFQSGYREFLTAIAVIMSGLSTVIFWLMRDKLKDLINRWDISPKKKFIIIGSLGAAYIETIFWIVEKIGNFEGLAAHPNLFIDLIITMPWYITMIALLWKVEKKQKYSYLEILLLGGIYDLFADGFVGQLFAGTLSLLVILQLFIIFPIFVLTYSFILLTPSYLLEDDIKSIQNEIEPDKGQNKLFLGLYPLLGLIILIIELFIIILLIASPILGIFAIILSLVIVIFWFRKKKNKNRN
jgi:hypothetical protein